MGPDGEFGGAGGSGQRVRTPTYAGLRALRYSRGHVHDRSRASSGNRRQYLYPGDHDVVRGVPTVPESWIGSTSRGRYRVGADRRPAGAYDPSDRSSSESSAGRSRSPWLPAATISWGWGGRTGSSPGASIRRRKTQAMRGSADTSAAEFAKKLQGTYGIFIDDAFSKTKASPASWLEARASDFGSEVLEVARAEFAGIVAKNRTTTAPRRCGT